MPSQRRTRTIAAEPVPVVLEKPKDPARLKSQKKQARPAPRTSTRKADKAKLKLTNLSEPPSDSTPQGLHEQPDEIEPVVQQEIISTEVPRRYNLRRGRQAVASVPVPSSALPQASKREKAALVSSKENPQPRRDLLDQTPVISPRQSVHIQNWASGIPSEGISKVPEVLEATRSDETGNLIDWYRSYGYQPPEESTMASTAADEAAQLGDAQSGKSRKPSGAANKPQFYAGLRDRNVNFKPFTDEMKSRLLKIITTKSTSEVTDEQEANWKLDILKCEMSQEAVFQRTMMVDVINRHKLGDSLDYIFESTWTCEPMPRLNSSESYVMAAPKPDLAIAFKTEAVLPEIGLPRLKSFISYICPEAYKEGKDDRAFHFFSLEAKGAQFATGDFIGFRQNHNTASQALHNMYMFMKLANREQQFFKDVRFFSATGTSSGFQFRVHRAVKVEEEFHIAENYPLGFRFDEIFRMEGNCKRADVCGVVENILFEYGVKILLPILQDAARIVLKKVRKTTKLRSNLGKRPAEDATGSFSTQRQAIGAFQLDDSQDSLLGQTITA